MANPRVFISSTCYDLSQIRDNLSEFISNYHFEPMLSEKGDVFYHPDFHTHDCCVNEIENCNLFILIIGGRFGGTYISDTKKSITNAEYEAAKIKNIPVFTFIKREVYEDHRVYQKNKDNKEIIDKIIFPSIENQKFAKDIFEFINQVRLSEVNNGFFSFEYVKEIEFYLKKQWAGMMFEFLNVRSKEKESKIFEKTLDNLTLLNKKSEELLENIFRKINPDEATKQINHIDSSLLASKFYSLLFKYFEVDIEKVNFEKVSKIATKESSWYEYVSKIPGFRLTEENDFDFPDTNTYQSELMLEYGRTMWTVKAKDGIIPKPMQILKDRYEDIKNLSQIDKLKALKTLNTI